MTLRDYRLGSLTLVIISTLVIFLGFFFVWVLVPAVAVGGFYFVFMALGRRNQVRRESEDEAIKDRLLAESRARGAEMRRQGLLRRVRLPVEPVEPETATVAPDERTEAAG